MQFDFQEKEEGLTPFRKRLLFAFGGVLVLFLVLVARFAWLQILNRDAYVERAERNRTVTVTTQGSRGLIFDRNGEALAKNDLGYSLEIVPDQVQNLSRTIDELPQFINVLKGDMSIVGPRPHMLQHTELYSKLVNKYMVRHLIKPGITGWAQVTGYRGETHELSQMEGRVRRDIWYLENWSLLLDIRIMLLTVWNALKRDENAY